MQTGMACVAAGLQLFEMCALFVRQAKAAVAMLGQASVEEGMLQIPDLFQPFRGADGVDHVGPIVIASPPLWMIVSI